MVTVKQSLNDAAREVIVLAEDAARQRKHNYLGTEHLLLGLIISNDGLTQDVLRELGVEPKKIIAAVDFIISRGDRDHKGSFELTKGAEKALKCAQDSAKKAGSQKIGPIHLFLGLIKEGEGIAAGVLEALGVSYERTQNAITRHRSQRRFDKFTERARRVLTFAQEEAMRLQHTGIGPEHLLLGLVREGDGVAAKVLVNLGVEFKTLRSAVEFIIGRGEKRPAPGEIGLTPAGKKVIELAVEQAQSLEHHYIGTEHILLGLLVLPEENVAKEALAVLAINFDRVRKETLRILARSMPTPTPRSGLSEEQKAKIEKALADSLAAFDQFEVDKENPARLEFETIGLELTQVIVRLINRKPGWIGFLHFAVDACGETSRADEIMFPGTVQDKWFDYICLNIWIPLFNEFAGLESSEIEKAQETVERIRDVLSQLKK